MRKYLLDIMAAIGVGFSVYMIVYTAIFVAKVVVYESEGEELGNQSSCPSDHVAACLCWRCVEVRYGEDDLSRFRSRGEDPLRCDHPDDSRSPISGDGYLCDKCGDMVPRPGSEERDGLSKIRNDSQRLLGGSKNKQTCEHGYTYSDGGTFDCDACNPLPY